MDRFEAMTVFTNVAQEGGFSAASRRLGMPLASVSRKVAELEAHLGTALFTRSTRQVLLTEAGEAFLATARRLLTELEEAERLASGEYRAPRGTLVVSAPAGLGSVYLAPIVNDFLAAYPDIDVQLLLADRVVNLLDDHIDVALRVAALPDSLLVAVKLGTVRQVMLASPAYIERRDEPTAPADLAAHDCVTFTALGQPDFWTFGAGGRVPIRSRLAVSTAEAAAAAAAAGLGVTRLLCYQATPSLMANTLRLLMRPHEPPPLPVHFVYPGGRLVPQKLRAFLDFTVPRMKQKLVFPF